MENPFLKKPAPQKVPGVNPFVIPAVKTTTPETVRNAGGFFSGLINKAKTILTKTPESGVDPALREQLIQRGKTEKLKELEQGASKINLGDFRPVSEAEKAQERVFQKEIGEGGEKVKEVAATIFQAPQRAITSVAGESAAGILGLIKGKNEEFKFEPKTEIEKALFGKEPITGIFGHTEEAQKQVEEVLQKIGIDKDVAKGQALVLAPLFVAGSVGLDLSPFGGEKNTAKLVAKSKSVDEIFDLIKPLFKESADDDVRIIAKQLTAVDQPEAVKDLLLQKVARPAEAKVAEAVVPSAKTAVPEVKPVVEQKPKSIFQTIGEKKKAQVPEASVVPKAEVAAEKPKSLFQKIGTAAEEAKTPRTEIKNFDDGVIERPKKMNTLAKRIIESDIMPEETRIFVRDNPGSYHEVLSDKEMRSLVDNLNEDELRSVFYEDESKAAVFAGQRLTKRLQGAGRFEEANEIIMRAQKMSVKGGQITQAQKIWSDWLTPEGKLFDINKKLRKEGRKLRPEDEKGLYEAFVQNSKTKAQMDDIIDKARETLDPKYIDEYKAVVKIYNTELRELQKKLSSALPRKISDTLTTIVQGNLLTPLSQIKNPLYNAIFLPFKTAQKGTAALADAVYSAIRSKPRTVKMGGPKAYLKGFGKGIKEAGEIFVKGSLPDEAGKIDNYRAFHPIRALASAFTGKGLPVSEKTGKVLIYDRVNKLVEGLFGGPPEAMFRLLSFGDKPFYQATRSSVVEELANLKKLTGDEKKIFTAFPDELSDDVIEAAARESVFQQDSTIAKGVNKGIQMLGNIRGIGGLAKFLARTQAIFVKTPVNVVNETLDFLVPPLSFARGVNAASKGNRRDALMYFGKATTGLMVGAVSAMLVKHGLVNGDLYEGKKQEALEYEAVPPRHVNLSGIRRLINGGNPQYRAGDVTMRYDMLGILGASMEMQFAASKEEKVESEGTIDTAVNELAGGIKDVFRVGNFAMNQSFLQGTNTLLETIANVDSAQGETKLNNWFKNTFNLITAIPFPNTLSGLTKTSDIYARETKGKTVSQTFDNVIKERLFGTYDLPAKLGLFGEKVLRTPEGRNAFVFNMLDPFKFQKIRNDRTYLALNNLYTKTNDPSVIPSIPAKSYTKDNETVDLNGKQYELYAGLIGRQRKELTEEAIQSDFWPKLSTEAQIGLLSDLYKKGMEVGKAKYFDEEAEPNPNISILKWQFADNNTSASRMDYGYYLASIGEDTNKSGEASKRDWEEYIKMVGDLKNSQNSASNSTNKNPFTR